MEIDPLSCQDSSPIAVHLSQKFMKVLIPTNISMVLVFNRKLSAVLQLSIIFKIGCFTTTVLFPSWLNSTQRRDPGPLRGGRRLRRKGHAVSLINIKTQETNARTAGRQQPHSMPHSRRHKQQPSHSDDRITPGLPSRQSLMRSVKLVSGLLVQRCI